VYAWYATFIPAVAAHPSLSTAALTTAALAIATAALAAATAATATATAAPAPAAAAPAQQRRVQRVPISRSISPYLPISQQRRVQRVQWWRPPGAG